MLKNSAVVPFGKGQIVLQKGVKRLFTKFILSSWSFKSVNENLKVKQTQDGMIHTYGKNGDSVQEDKPNSLFNQFAEDRTEEFKKLYQDKLKKNPDSSFKKKNQQ